MRCLAANNPADRWIMAKAAKAEADRPETQKAEAEMLREIRSLLYELNFDPGDGQGNKLSQAIRDFEKTRRMAETGQPTAELLQRLREAPALTPWGAIVYAPQRRKWGISWGQDTREAAVARARAKCGTPERCPKEIRFFGALCGAFAHSNSGGGMAISNSIQQAKKEALSVCSNQGKGRSCSIVAAVCADGTEHYEFRQE
jgi:peptidoglycan hydrolase-like protein with peptidoglycan-binding domain